MQRCRNERNKHKITVFSPSCQSLEVCHANPATKTFKFQTYVKKNTGTINIHNHPPGPGRPPSDESMDAEIKARVSDSDLNAVMAFCRGRKISRSEYIRHLMSLDTEYFDYLHLLNDPALKQLIFNMLSVAGKI